MKLGEKTTRGVVGVVVGVYRKRSAQHGLQVLICVVLIWLRERDLAYDTNFNARSACPLLRCDDAFSGGVLRLGTSANKYVASYLAF